jgi:hypothetical protein
MPSVLDGRMARDIAQFGIDALSLEVLEVVDATPEMTDGQVRNDLATLESLWCEKLGSSTLY